MHRQDCSHEASNNHSHSEECSCGCNQTHHHNNHGHTHTHDHSCTSEAEHIIENALVYSKKGSFKHDYPCTADEALKSVVSTVSHIASLVAQDNVVLGHVKALLECEGGKATISLTAVDEPSITHHKDWQGSQKITMSQLTLNVHSLVNIHAPIEGEVSKFLL